MNTQQAHSGGISGDAISLRRDSWSAQRAVPATWLNLVCLDAPFVAIAWLWLFAHTFRVPLQPGNAVALFLTAWLIYLADRFADAATLKRDLPRSLRQEFCLHHREFWIATLALVAAFDAYVIWRTTAFQTFLVGAIVGVLAVVYLVMNHPLGLIWRSLPAKECAIGVLFAAGTVVALLPAIPMTPAFVCAALGFAALCSLNCISIASWERKLDLAQHKVSVATRHPNIARHIPTACAIAVLAALVLAIIFPSAIAFFACISASALLLKRLDRSFGADERTALADLVLLTPLVAMLVAAL